MEPVPSPTVIPSSTSSAAASAAARFSRSTSGPGGTAWNLRARLTDGPRRRARVTRIGRRDGDDRSAHGDRPRHALHQHDPDPVDRRHPEGQLRPSGHADGDGPGRLHALAALPALRPGGPDLAQPRPLRALRRARLDAALLAASPDHGRRRSTPTTRRSGSRRSAWTTSSRSASSTPRRPAIPSTT